MMVILNIIILLIIYYIDSSISYKYYNHYYHYTNRLILSLSNNNDDNDSINSNINNMINIDEILSLIDDDNFTNTIRKDQPIQGTNINIDIYIDFNTSIYGGNKDIKIRKYIQCKKCNGKGYNNNNDDDDDNDVCSNCNGKCTTMIIKDIDINIPIGINSNTIIKVNNEGNDGLYGGKNGDLFVNIIIKDNDSSSSSSIYKRYGIIDIISNEEISYYDAILGTTKEVDTIHGKLLIDIPKGTQHNDMIKIKNYGIRVSQSQQGDAYINMKIKIPNEVSKEEYRLLSLIQSHILNK